MYQLNDTIVAIATAPGEGGVGIVRLSGPSALAVAARVYSGSRLIEDKRSFLHGVFRDPASGETLDEGILLVMPGPRSYTGEDVVEFHTHGSPAVLARLTALLVQLGARPALAGEFTYRAFRNGRLDLSQAEAVQALVGAHGEAARREALRQLSGGLSVHLEPLEEKLKSLYVQLEARLEFSEDGLPPLDVPEYETAVKDCRETLKGLLDSYSQGRVLREGLVVALVGAPNVGKSSLLNRLLGLDRAIVTPQPGTTRDVVEGELKLGGQRIRLFDTAGLRASQDPIEEEGVRRSRKILEEADLVFWVLDASAPQAGLQEALGLKADSRTRFLVNKTDLAPNTVFSFPPERTVRISCWTGEGVEKVKELLEAVLQKDGGAGDVVLTQERHQKEISGAAGALERLQALMAQGATHETWAEELKEAALRVGRVRGRNLPEDAFQDIFSKFCIGK